MARKKNEPSPDAAERKALLDYIKALNPNANFIAIASQLKRMTDEGMTYSGIRYALWYSVNVKQMPYKGVGIVPYQRIKMGIISSMVAGGLKNIWLNPTR